MFVTVEYNNVDSAVWLNSNSNIYIAHIT